MQVQTYYLCTTLVLPQHYYLMQLLLLLFRDAYADSGAAPWTTRPLRGMPRYDVK